MIATLDAPIEVKECPHMNRRAAIRERAPTAVVGNGIASDHARLTVAPSTPFSMKNEKQDANKAIRTYCLWCMTESRQEVALCPSIGCPLHHYRKG